MRTRHEAQDMAGKGFTLVDLIVSIAIFTMIATVTIANFRAGASNDAVRQGAAIAAQELRRAQTATLTGAKLSDGTFPVGGYGVRLDENDTASLVFFADIDGNLNYTDATEELDTVGLPGGTVFGGSTLNILFSAPDADVYFNGSAVDASQTITFSSPSAAATQAVIIYRLSGQIRVQ